jgi:hypothetical protein
MKKRDNENNLMLIKKRGFEEIEENKEFID